MMRDNDSSSIVMSPLQGEESSHRTNSSKSCSFSCPSAGKRVEIVDDEEKKDDSLLGEMGAQDVERMKLGSEEGQNDNDNEVPSSGSSAMTGNGNASNRDGSNDQSSDDRLEITERFLQKVEAGNGNKQSASSDDEQELTEQVLQKLEAASAGSSTMRTGSARRDRFDHGSERSFSSRGSSSAQLVSQSIRRSVVSGSRTIGKAGTFIANNSRAAGAQAATSIAKGSRAAGVQAERLIVNAGDKGRESLKKAQQVGTNLVTSAGAVVPMLLLHKSEGQALDAGFVVFTNLYTVQTALQMIHHPKPYVMDVIPAGDPRDIFWRNVGLPHRARRTGILAAVTASVVLCFFWSIPVAFISSLTEVNSLKESLPTVEKWIEEYVWLETILAQIAPMLLLFLNEVILPAVLKYFATWEGHISSAMLEASLFTKLSCYMVSLFGGIDVGRQRFLLLHLSPFTFLALIPQIIQTFFVSALSGSLAAELTNILEDPGSVLTLLANSLPAQSSYFIQIALAQTFFLQALETLRIYPLGLALLRRYIGPRLTAKERRRSYGWLASLDEPPDFWHAETFAQLILFYMVFFVYSTIAPVTSFFLCFCFILTESGYRYQFIHNYPRNFETGGVLWKDFIKFVLASMVSTVDLTEYACCVPGDCSSQNCS